MGLRRLFSGWLIAMAALARSMALALERAAADRSGPAPASGPSPLMAALAERYPGAPAHWLAHVAERTSQLAQDGQAPLPVSSDTGAWSPLRPVLSAEPAPSPAREAVTAGPPPAPRRPAPRPDATPSLADLKDRSSGVWRRPDAAPRRRPRPVFAPIPSAAPAKATSVPDAGAGPAGEPRPAPAHDEGASSAEARRGPSGEGAWPDRGPVPADAPTRSLAVPTPATKAAPALPPLSLSPEVRDRTDAPPGQGDSMGAAQPPPRRAFFAEPFFASPARPAPSFPDPDADRSTAASPSPTPTRERAPPRRGALSWPARVRSATRRPIFRPAATVDAEPSASFATPAPAAVLLPLAPPVSSAGPGMAGDPHSSAPRSPAPIQRAPSQADRRREPAFATLANSLEADPAPGPRFTSGPAPDERTSPVFAAARTVTPSRPPGPLSQRSSPSRSAGQTARVDRQPVDDRWPSFPPAVFTPPSLVAAPSPRLDLLAQEQEEGRWNV